MFKKVNRYLNYTHIKVKSEFLKVIKKVTRANTDGKGWITYHTEQGEYTDSQIKGHYIKAEAKK